MPDSLPGLGLPDPEKTLAESNEPDMVAALDAKEIVDKDAAAGPAEFRAGEGEQLGGARKEVGDAATASLGTMFGTRSNLINGVVGGQSTGMSPAAREGTISTNITVVQEPTW